jgi:hypothetical protein
MIGLPDHAESQCLKPCLAHPPSSIRTRATPPSLGFGFTTEVLGYPSGMPRDVEVKIVSAAAVISAIHLLEVTFTVDSFAGSKLLW